MTPLNDESRFSCSGSWMEPTFSTAKKKQMKGTGRILNPDIMPIRRAVYP